MRASTLVYALVIGWAGAVLWSIQAGASVDGPRTLETGLKRMDVIFWWQLLALFLAILSAVTGFVVARTQRYLRWVGLIPIALTALALLGIILFVSLFAPKPSSAFDPPKDIRTVSAKEPSQARSGPNGCYPARETDRFGAVSEQGAGSQSPFHTTLRLGI